MASEQKGIQETIDFFEFAIAFVEAVRVSKENDGEINIKTDFLNFIKPITLIPKAYEGADEIPAELVDVDDMEAEVLRGKFGEVVDDPDFQDLFKGTLIQARAIRNIIAKRKAKAEATEV